MDRTQGYERNCPEQGGHLIQQGRARYRADGARPLAALPGRIQSRGVNQRTMRTAGVKIVNLIWIMLSGQIRSVCFRSDAAQCSPMRWQQTNRTDWIVFQSRPGGWRLTIVRVVVARPPPRPARRPHSISARSATRDTVTNEDDMKLPDDMRGRELKQQR